MPVFRVGNHLVGNHQNRNDGDNNGVAVAEEIGNANQNLGGKGKLGLRVVEEGHKRRNDLHHQHDHDRNGDK